MNRHHQRLILVGLASLWTACAASSRYGDFVSDGPPHYASVMGDDALSLLVTLYPPSRTEFLLPQGDSEEFGAALSKRLRHRGYGLSTSPSSKRDTGRHTLRYVVDRIEGTDLYRVMLQVDDVELVRAYAQSGSRLDPTGSWSRKELPMEAGP